MRKRVLSRISYPRDQGNYDPPIRTMKKITDEVFEYDTDDRLDVHIRGEGTINMRTRAKDDSGWSRLTRSHYGHNCPKTYTKENPLVSRDNAEGPMYWCSSCGYVVDRYLATALRLMELKIDR